LLNKSKNRKMSKKNLTCETPQVESMKTKGGTSAPSGPVGGDKGKSKGSPTTGKGGNLKPKGGKMKK
jgi:hypothetical protein